MPLPKMSTKELLREKIKKGLKDIPREEFHSQGVTAATLLRSSPVWARYTTILLFLSLKSEIDTQPLVETTLKEGKKLFVPRIEADTRSVDRKTGDRLVFYPVVSPDGPWLKGPLGIREPCFPEGTLPPQSSGGRQVPETVDFPALILVPGLAFDREGNRLGRGRGYYDRFFAELDEEGREYTPLGLCMDFQIVDRVPVEENDKKMSGFLTGKEIIISPSYLEKMYSSAYFIKKGKEHNGKN